MFIAKWLFNRPHNLVDVTKQNIGKTKSRGQNHSHFVLVLSVKEEGKTWSI